MTEFFDAHRPNDKHEAPIETPELRVNKTRLTVKFRRAINVERSGNKCKVTERLRSVAELFAGPGNFLAEHSNVVAIAHNILKYRHRLVQVFLVVDAGTRHSLAQPESAH